MIERQAVIDDVIRAHAKGKIPESSDSVVTVVGTQERFSDSPSLAVQHLQQLWRVDLFVSNLPTVYHNGSLWQSCGAGGVNIK